MLYTFEQSKPHSRKYLSFFLAGLYNLPPLVIMTPRVSKMPESAQWQYWNSAEHFKPHSMRSFNFLCQAALTHNNLGKFYPNESGNCWHSNTKIDLDLLYLLSSQCLPVTVKAPQKVYTFYTLKEKRKIQMLLVIEYYLLLFITRYP